MNLRGNPTRSGALACSGLRKCTVASLASGLLLTLAVSGPPLFAQDASLENTAPGDPDLASTQAADSRDEQNYRRLIEELESERGAYADELPEQLLSLGLALQRDGRHPAAVGVFKRGVHLARINNGLYSAQQLPLLQAQINSHIASGQYQEADERQHYMYRVQMRTLDSGLSRADAFMQQADWQHNAYQLSLDEEGFGRLMSMWDLYRLALNDMVSREGEDSPSLLVPLEGMLQAQYLISAHRIDGGNAMDSYAGQVDKNRFSSYRAQSYRKGQAVVIAMHDIEAAQHGRDSLDAARSIVMLGDWMQWHGQADSALETWHKAIGELAGSDGAEQSIAQLFGEPVPLPDIDGMRPLPPSVPPAEGTLQVAFGVTASGKVVEMERLDDNEIEKHKVNRLLRSLRRTVFRPRFEAGEPVATERLVKAYDIR